MSGRSPTKPGDDAPDPRRDEARREAGLAPPDDLDGPTEPRPPRRVTLTFSGPPLQLPGEGAPTAGRRGESQAGLALPEGAGAGGGPARDPSGVHAVHDAWVLAREEPVPGGGVRTSLPPSSSRPPGLDRLTRTSPAARGPRRRSPSTDALELVEQSRSSRPGAPASDPAAEMAERFALGDFTGALTVAELLLGRDPGHEAAGRYAEGCRERLAQLYTSRLGRLDRVPRVAVPDAEIRWLGLDHHAAFLLSRIDGESTVEDLLHVVAMPRVDALKTLVELLDAQAIEMVG